MSLTLALLAAATIQPRITDQRDPLNDNRIVVVMLDHGRTYIGAGCSDAGNPSSIMVLAKFERFVGRERQGIIAGGTPIQYRFDQRPPRSENWSSQRYTVSEHGASAMRFLLAMKGSRQLYLRAQRKDRDIVQISFNYSDPTRQVEEVLRRCGYNPDGTRAASTPRN